MRPPYTVLIMSLLAGGLDARTSVIVDTDAGNDDLLAIAFLLARKDVKVEAITVVDGLAHVPSGAANVLRLLEAAGAPPTPVYLGRTTPLERTSPFPDDWRKTADAMPGVPFPKTRRMPETVPAPDFLAGRLHETGRPVTVLALGPLSNLADAMQRRGGVPALREIVIMGGALHARGNLDDGGFFKTANTTAEWNLFHDPLAAEIVFRSGAPIRVIPLDATNKVPIDTVFLNELAARVRTPLGRLAAAILETARPHIENHFYFAWDPLAAAALVDPAVVTVRRMALEVRRKPPEQGRMVEAPKLRPNATVALDADAARFRKMFLDALR
ncbi:MAG TPA: nucleoside hydrolase [Bryobacteraceae bacterium]|nr:nucleoside hydrolase [Bryobacteraceae bacterium]